MSESKAAAADVEAGSRDNAPLIEKGGKSSVVDINAWKKHMYPVWLAGLLLLIIEYTFCTIFVANINYLWVGVLVACVLWITTLVICLCCVVPRQAPEQKWLGKAVVGTVMGVMGLALVGGLIGATYLEEYRAVRSGTSYTSIKASKSASSLTDATAITFTSTMSVLLTGGARSNSGLHFGHYSCVAPIIVSDTPFSTVSYWASLESHECCKPTSSFSSCPGWDGSWTQSLVYTDPSDALIAAAALSISNSGSAYSAADTVIYTRLVESIDAVQNQRLEIVLVCYCLPALVALLWLPAFIMFHNCGCCNKCQGKPREHEHEKEAEASAAASASASAAPSAAASASASVSVSDSASASASAASAQA